MEEEPLRRKQAISVGDDLSNLSVAELDERIGVLESEIVRVRTARDAKTKSLAAAEAFFRGKS